ncbi:MAG: autotransporter outer membrane beta-barrel domain-containing protein, partial [Parachlamydiaceae bacterium]
RYTIMQGSSVTGTYGSLSSSGMLNLIRPGLFYDPQHVYLIFTTNTSSVAQTCQQQIIARQIDGITNANSQQSTILNQLIILSNPDIRRALDTMAGEQHSDDLLTTGIINRQFIRRLYDPLRPTVTKNCETPRCWGLFQNLSQFKDTTFWGEFGGGQTHLYGKGGTYGLNMRGCELTLGFQKSFPYNLIFGLAGSHEFDSLQYAGHGSGKSSTGFLGAYGLYRPNFWYVLANFAYGNSTNTLKRTIIVGSSQYKTSSHPTVNQFSFYSELGYDLQSKYILTQLFAGIESGSYSRGRASEHSSSGFQLIIDSRYYTNVFSRFGVHISTYRLPCNTFASLDLSWLKKLVNTQNNIRARFADFGNPFTINGTKLDNNTFEAAFTISSRFFRDLRVYAETTGEIGSNFYSYNVQGGLEFVW